MKYRIALCVLSLRISISPSKDKPLEDYVNNATAERVQATIDGNVARGNIAKLVVNSGYGKTNENTNNHHRCSLIPKDKLSKKRLVVEINDVVGEVESGYVEAVCRYKSKANKVPG